MKNKFDFYEIVKIKSNKLSLRRINGQEGAVIGMSQNETTGRWGYAVNIFSEQFGWDIMEDDLLYTGKKLPPEQFKPVDTVRVIVDPITGEGRLKEE